MALTFYYGSGSPYAWRVWLALEWMPTGRFHSSFPLLRSRAMTMPDLPAPITMSLPPASIRIGGSWRSQSLTSCGVSW